MSEFSQRAGHLSRVGQATSATGFACGGSRQGTACGRCSRIPPRTGRPTLSQEALTGKPRHFRGKPESLAAKLRAKPGAKLCWQPERLPCCKQAFEENPQVRSWWRPRAIHAEQATSGSGLHGSCTTNTPSGRAIPIIVSTALVTRPRSRSGVALRRKPPSATP